MHVGFCDPVLWWCQKRQWAFCGLCWRWLSQSAKTTDFTTCWLSARLSWCDFVFRGCRKRQCAFCEVLSWSDSVFGGCRKKQWAFCEVVLAAVHKRQDNSFQCVWAFRKAVLAGAGRSSWFSVRLCWRELKGDKQQCMWVFCAKWGDRRDR